MLLMIFGKRHRSCFPEEGFHVFVSRLLCFSRDQLESVFHELYFIPEIPELEEVVNIVKSKTEEGYHMPTSKVFCVTHKISYDH